MKKVIAKNFIIYSLPNIIARFIPFITLPFTTKYLTLIDFGYIAIFELCIIPFQVVLGFGPGYVINSVWYKLDKNERGELIFSLLIVGSAIIGIMGLFIGIISNAFFPLIAGEEWAKIRPLFLFLLIGAVSIIPLSIFDSWVIIEKKAKLSSAIKITQIIAGAFAIIFIAKYTQNYKYVIIGNVMVSAFISFIQLIYLIKILRITFKKRWFSLIYKISSPIFLRSLFNVLRTQFDRIMVSRVFGAGQFAVYNFSSKVNNIFNEVDRNYQNSYDPYIYKGLAEKNLDTRNLRFIFFVWSYAAFVFCSGLILFGERIIELFTNGVFVEAYPLVILYTCVLVIILPFMGNGQVVIFFQKTKYLLFITVIQALIIMSLAVTLIPKYGSAAGIFSFWFGTLVYMLLYFYKKRQLYNVEFAEKILLPYVCFYHLIAGLKFFKFDIISNFLVIILITIMSVHLFVSNRLILRKVLPCFKRTDE